MTATAPELDGDYVLDTARTRVGFVAKHTIGPRVRGRFTAFAGAAHLDGAEPERSTCAISIEAVSIDTGNPRRDVLLRRDFLDTARHPELTFVSTGVERLGGEAFALTGDLTMRGATQRVTVRFAATSAGFTGTATIDRARWGLSARGLVEAMVTKAVELELEISLRRAPGAP
ncbi:MAG: YceI family protein [Nonomuraea sp.]|nr:YceI family protein [Nonomuraea sp.]